MEKINAPLTDQNEKGPNWDSILRYSFLFSQGSPEVQARIFNYLAEGPLKGADVGEDYFKKNMLSIGAHNLGTQGLHLRLEKVTEDYMTESQERDRLIRSFQSHPPRETNEVTILRDLVSALIDRDFQMTTDRLNKLPENTERDRYTSFIVDYGFLQKGTHHWLWNGVPEPYKKMWEEVVTFLEENPGFQHQDLEDVLNHYIEHHPDLSDEERSRIEQFAHQEA